MYRKIFLVVTANSEKKNSNRKTKRERKREIHSKKKSPKYRINISYNHVRVLNILLTYLESLLCWIYVINGRQMNILWNCWLKQLSRSRNVFNAHFLSIKINLNFEILWRFSFDRCVPLIFNLCDLFTVNKIKEFKNIWPQFNTHTYTQFMILREIQTSIIDCRVYWFADH